MNADLHGIDPVWAWSEYEPTADRPWNRALAAHLFRRAGFAASRSELDDAAGRSPKEVVDRLLQPNDESGSEGKLRSFDETVVAGGNVERLPAWWLYRMRYTHDPLLEKLTLFWHGHFATSAAKVNDIRIMFAQHELLRRHARGHFGPLVHAISRDPAMLHYLDAATNRKTHPNENYARELLELFCLGTGNYTEHDVQELARAFTGWEVQRKRFVENEYEHDARTKSILGQTGTFGGDDGVEIVLAHPATARFLAGKLFRFFVCDEPAPPDALIDPLAKALRQSDYDIGRTVRTMLGSQLYFSAHAVGRKVRSPVELGIGLMRALEAQGNLSELAQRLAEIGQRLFYPPSVKGWDGGRSWINSSTLLGRVNLAGAIVRSADLAKLTARAAAESPDEIVDWALELLVAVPISAEIRQPLVDLAKRKDDKQQQVADVLHAVCALPEFQLN
jgi:uncharacterized protein (DUF1800 family)